MSTAHHDLAHLLALIEAARSHAARIGPEVGSVSRLLDEAVVAVLALEGHGGRPDEGLRPQDLTTDNDL